MDTETLFIVTLLILALSLSAIFAVSFVLVKIEARQKNKPFASGSIPLKKVSIVMNIVWMVLLIPVTTAMSFSVLTAQYMIPISGIDGDLMLLVLLSAATPVFGLLGVITSLYLRKVKQLALSVIVQIFQLGGVFQLIFFTFWAL